PDPAPPQAAEPTPGVHVSSRHPRAPGTRRVSLCASSSGLVSHLKESSPQPAGPGEAGGARGAQRRSQAVRVALQGPPGAPGNQSAVVDRARSTVTYYVPAQSNGSAVVLYDGENVSRHVCYKPAGQRVCYLRAMDSRDLQQLRAALDAPEQAASVPLNGTKRSREFLAVLAGTEVDPAGLGAPVRALCAHSSIFRARRTQGKWSSLRAAVSEQWHLAARCAPGPGRQRLIYLCIDICFPSNICVSICFYYLPE
uniref:BRICHOS domain containing 5 n=1 Tax=Nothoprocta perdicaria TaxID=30464 RepID=A0A8C6ZTV2_NOTPE